MAENFILSYILKMQDELTGPLGKVGSAFDGLDKQTSKLGLNLADKLKAVAKPAAWIGFATESAFQFEKVQDAYREMGHAFEGENVPGGIDRLKTSLSGLNKVLPQSKTELIGFATLAAKMHELKDVPGFVTFVSNLTNANEDLAGEAGVELWMDLARTMQMTQAEYEHFGNVTTVTAHKFHTSARSMLDNTLELSHMRVLAGTPREQIMAIGAWADTLGTSGGMALKRLTYSMAAAGTGKNNLAAVFGTAMGMSAGQFMEEWKKNQALTLSKYVGGLGSLGETKRRFELQTILGITGMESPRLMGFIGRAAAGAAELPKILATISDEEKLNGAMAAEAAEKNKRLSVQFGMLAKAGKSFSEQFGMDINPVMTKMVALAQQLAFQFTDLAPATRYVVEGLMGMMALKAILPLLIRIGPLVIAALVNPLTVALAAVLAITAATKALADNWSTLSEPGWLKDLGAYVLYSGSFHALKSFSPENMHPGAGQQGAPALAMSRASLDVRVGVDEDGRVTLRQALKSQGMKTDIDSVAHNGDPAWNVRW